MKTHFPSAEWLTTVSRDRLEEIKKEIFEKYDELSFEPGFEEFRETLRKELSYRRGYEIL